MDNISNNFTIIAKVISLQFEKPYLSIVEEDAVRLESLGVNVKRVSSDKFGSSQQVAVKMAPEFKQLPDCIVRPNLQIGGTYEVDINPYAYTYNGKKGVSLQANFLRLLPRDDVVRPRLI
jgi:hypothetical protein